ncbi:hypothetical protein [Pengzhenrongella frigida]|uniref:Uncharacterized protein n=1 Tax=Pengzhenrongella frigida TaxID=1259133 RepID=A0A4V1ZHQ5_9MICO|nr:hypothetical protein [Cellulomonas sp. HLT2-17]RYV52864.1 hypothetical protein EUA98_01320 [Cellulomonas sp. HLT2-17]
MTTWRFGTARPWLVIALAVALVAAVLALTVPRFMAARNEAARTATRELAQAIVLPPPATEGCEPATGVRCWTTPAEGQDALDGIAGLLGALGVQDLTERCGEPLPQLTVPSCSVSGWYRGDVVLISANPTLLPDPPVRTSGSTLTLLAAVD